MHAAQAIAHIAWAIDMYSSCSSGCAIARAAQARAPCMQLRLQFESCSSSYTNRARATYSGEKHTQRGNMSDTTRGREGDRERQRRNESITKEALESERERERKKGNKKELWGGQRVSETAREKARSRDRGRDRDRQPET